MDAIDTLPLSFIPLTSNSLKSAKLIKNARMETSVELHNDPISGSFQIHPDDISEAFRGAEKDQEIIRQLANLQSYDVYSLRASMKKLGLEIADPSMMQLSANMKDTLNQYTAQFTRPLIEKIFGGNRIELDAKEGLQKIFRDPDVTRVRENLKIMTEKTGIPLQDIPKFIEEYSDVFLSLAYYKYSFESVGGSIDRFLFWVSDLKSHRDITSSSKTLSSCKKTEDTLKFITNSIRERLIRLHSSFETFWKDINGESFITLRQQIEDNHTSMGAVLCALVVKMRNWEKEFPDNTVGGPQTRAKFVVSELEPGLEKLKKMENESRARLGLSVQR